MIQKAGYHALNQSVTRNLSMNMLGRGIWPHTVSIPTVLFVLPAAIKNSKYYDISNSNIPVSFTENRPASVTPQAKSIHEGKLRKIVF